MNPKILQPPRTIWHCPNCPQTAVSRETEPHTKFHSCPGLRGLTAPMVREGDDVRVEALEREDYVGAEDVQRDVDGRPVSAVVTTYADGRNDCVVFAPTAHAAIKN